MVTGISNLSLAFTDTPALMVWWHGSKPPFQAPSHTPSHKPLLRWVSRGAKRGGHGRMRGNEADLLPFSGAARSPLATFTLPLFHKPLPLLGRLGWVSLSLGTAGLLDAPSDTCEQSSRPTKLTPAHCLYVLFLEE